MQIDFSFEAVDVNSINSRQIRVLDCCSLFISMHVITRVVFYFTVGEVQGHCNVLVHTHSSKTTGYELLAMPFKELRRQRVETRIYSLGKVCWDLVRVNAKATS